jgi:AraC-like DNA-binding protein
MSPWPDILETRDPDVAYRHLSGCYVGVDHYDVVGKPGEFRLSRQKMELDRFVVVRGKLRTGYRLRALPGSQLVTIIPESGGLAMKSGRCVAESGRRGDGVVAPRDRFSVEMGATSGFTLLVGHDHVVRHFEELDEPATIKAVNGAEPLNLDLSSPVGVHFRSALNFVWGQLASSGTVRPPALLTAALEEVLFNGFMLLLSSSGTSRREWIGADPGRRSVLEACEIMRARIEEPVRIGEIARTLGISARHLQAGFRRHLGKSPRAFLTQCRLDLARRKLEQGGPGLSVTAAALECGFSNLGEFAGKYRRQFGENPSETLKRTR